MRDSNDTTGELAVAARSSPCSRCPVGAAGRPPRAPPRAARKARRPRRRRHDRPARPLRRHDPALPHGRAPPSSGEAGQRRHLRRTRQRHAATAAEETTASTAASATTSCGAAPATTSSPAASAPTRSTAKPTTTSCAATRRSTASGDSGGGDRHAQLRDRRDAGLLRQARVHLLFPGFSAYQDFPQSTATGAASTSTWKPEDFGDNGRRPRRAAAVDERRRAGPDFETVVGTPFADFIVGTSVGADDLRRRRRRRDPRQRRRRSRSSAAPTATTAKQPAPRSPNASSAAAKKK